MLDWDNAGPGSRVWDLACSAYAWVPLYPRVTAVDLTSRARRLTRFCATYGEVTARETIETLIEQLGFIASFMQTEADAGDAGLSKLASWGVPSRLRSDAETLRTQTEVLSNGRDR